MSTYAGSSGRTPNESSAGKSYQGRLDFLKQLVLRVGQNDFPGMAAEMAYNWMLALFPLLIFMFSVFGMITADQGTFQQVMSYLERLAPPEAFGVVRSTLQEVIVGGTGGVAVAALVGALWAGSNGAVSIEKAINRAYRCVGKPRNFFLKRLIGLVIVLGMALILLVFSNLVIFGNLLIGLVDRYFDPGQFVLRTLDLARWLIPIAGLILVTMFNTILALGGEIQ